MTRLARLAGVLTGGADQAHWLMPQVEGWAAELQLKSADAARLALDVS